jgi:alpha-D-ribose 1-methylphosphonate 5-triphosphate synthase subunit PhnH
MTQLHPGFADPVAGAQICFRAVLDAMARPGAVITVDLGLHPPAPLHAATAAVLLTLTDAETPVWLDGECAAARDWLAFHCGAPAAASPAAAMFVTARALPDLAALNAGTHDDPETSATVILQVDSLNAGRGLSLQGPGLAAPGTIAVAGLPDNFAAGWAANHALYPRGVDLILCAGDRLAALPRSVRVSD